jgi:hypothetical protein
MKPLRIAGRALAASALLLVVACGDDDDTTAGDDTTTTTTTTAPERDQQVDQEALDRVTAAVENTVAEGTARFDVTVETQGTGTGGDGEQPIEAEGEVDFDQEMRLITLSGPDGDLDVVIDGEIAYVELPATEGDDWMRIDLSALFDEDLGMGGPAGIPYQDPADNLRLLEGSAVHAQEAGEETVDGIDTTRYELVIDLEDAADEASQDVQDAVSAMAERTGLSELDIEVWVDDDDLIRRVAYTLDLGQAEVQETGTDAETDATVEADPQGTVTVTVDYRDFGATLDIEVPADEDVIDLDEDAVRDALSGGTSSRDSGTTTTTTDGTTDTDDTDTDAGSGAGDGDGTTTTTMATTTTGG